MKRLPNFIIFKQALRYLPESEQQDLIKNVSNLNIKNKAFLNRIKKCFDIELFKTKSLIWQDVWLYNYIQYDTEHSLKRSGLIAQYEKEAFYEDDSAFWANKDILNSKELK